MKMYRYIWSLIMFLLISAFFSIPVKAAVKMDDALILRNKKGAEEYQIKGMTVSSDGTLFIPDEVETVNPIDFYDNRFIPDIKNVKVSSGNEYFTVKQGVLFTKNKRTLVFYPWGKTDTTYKIPSSVRSIGALAFLRCSNIKKVVLPKKLTSIGAGAFCGCRKLSKINLTKKTKIKKLTDYNATDGTRDYTLDYGSSKRGKVYQSGFDLLFDGGINYDGKSSFYFGTFEGTALQSAVIPDSVKYVGSDTFKPRFDCETASFVNPVKSLYIGKNYIGGFNQKGADKYGAVYEGSKSLMLSWLPLESVTISSKNKKYKVKNHAVYSKNGKKLYQVLNTSALPEHYVLDARTKWIAPRAFSWINTIKEISIKGNISIDSSAFNKYHYGCKLGDKYNEYINGYAGMEALPDVMTKITVKGNVKKIGKYAFYDCDALEIFHCTGSINNIAQKAFASCGSLSSFTYKGKIGKLDETAFAYCINLKSIQ